MATDWSLTSRAQYYFNPWWRERHIYMSALPAAECHRLIDESTTPFFGRIRRGFFSSADFTLHRMSFFRNSFWPYAYVNSTNAATGGTLVAVTLSSARSVRLFFIVWFGFLGLWSSLAASAVVQRGGDALLFPLIGVGMAAFGYLLCLVGRAIADDDAEFLITFLRNELGLQEPPASALLLAQP